jgi:hypothetical protein
MASTACFLHHHALTTASRSSSQRQVANIRTSTQLVCRAQKQEAHEDGANAVSRRLALTVLIGAAAIGSKVSPADAAYGEAGIFLSLIYVFCLPIKLIKMLIIKIQLFQKLKAYRK